MERSIGITFENLSYWTKDGKQIIHSINGNYTGGKLIGILGPSGAGKTTLLNLLSGFISSGYLGTMKINERPLKLESFKKMARFIMQENNLHELLTVEENMKFATDLQLGYEVDDNTKKIKINNILRKFGLEQIRTTTTSQISGGEKKRLAICLELISNPSIIFLDESTSGLDTVSSHTCIKFLKDLTMEGTTVVCSIHQPSTSLFHYFDLVYILADGKCIYEGSPLDIIDFLDSNGLSCNIHHSPADFAIEIASGEYGKEVIDKLVKNLKNKQEEIKQETDNNSDSQEDYSPEKKSLRHLMKHNIFEIKTLASREIAKLKHNWTLLHLRIGAQLVCAIFICSLFWDIGMDASKLWYNLNLVIIIVGCISSIQAYANILSFPTEVPIIRKEYFNGYFSFLNYYIVIAAWDVIFSVIVTILMSMIYFLSGQPNELFRILMFSTIGFLSAMNGQSIGLLTGSVASIQTGLLIATFINLVLFVISGFCIAFKDVPLYFRWLLSISYLRYGITGIGTAIWGYNRDKLVCSEESDLCLFIDTRRFLDEFGIEANTFWRDCGVLILNYIILKVITYYCLKRRLKTRD